LDNGLAVFVGKSICVMGMLCLHLGYKEQGKCTEYRSHIATWPHGYIVCSIYYSSVCAFVILLVMQLRLLAVITKLNFWDEIKWYIVFVVCSQSTDYERALLVQALVYTFSSLFLCG
jgi:hypothetical protein